MWPTLLSVGVLQISTSTVLLLMGFLVSGFAFWRRGKEEHYSELQLFDGFILSFLVGILFSRIAFILLHFSQFGWDVFAWLNVVGQPGSQDIVFLVAATVFLYRFAHRKKWDAFEILDFWSIALTVWLFFSSMADFASGAARGKFTSWVVGVVFPGSIEKTHPAQLYMALGCVLLYVYLTWAESRYRIFEWYRMGKKSAQTGFLISTFCVFFSLLSAMMLFFRLPEFLVFGWALDFWIYLVGIIVGIQILLRRSDKPLLPSALKERLAPETKEPLIAPPSPENPND